MPSRGNKVSLFVGRFKASISLEQGKFNNATSPPAAWFIQQGLKIRRYCKGSHCILPKTMSIVRPYLYLSPKEQSKNWRLEHWNTLVQSQNWGRYLEVWQVGKSRPCSLIQFFALSAPTVTNGEVCDDTDPRFCYLTSSLPRFSTLASHSALLCSVDLSYQADSKPLWHYKF